MRKIYKEWLAKLERFTDRRWYLLLISFLAFLDLFIFIIPTDTLLISFCVFHPNKWRKAFFYFTTSSAIGGLLMALAIRGSNNFFLKKLFSVGLNPSKWQKTADFIERHGAPALALHALGPFPLQPGVVVVALGSLSLLKLFLAIWVGRGIKYYFFSWAGARAPHLLGRLGIRF